MVADASAKILPHLNRLARPSSFSHFEDQLLPNLKRFVPALQGIRMIPGCGHWTQQERPAEVNAALLEFLGSLPA